MTNSYQLHWIEHLVCGMWCVQKKNHDWKINKNLTHGCMPHMKQGHLCTKWLEILLDGERRIRIVIMECEEWRAKRVCCMMKLIYLLWIWYFCMLGKKNGWMEENNVKIFALPAMNESNKNMNSYNNKFIRIHPWTNITCRWIWLFRFGRHVQTVDAGWNNDSNEIESTLFKAHYL